MVSLQFSPYFKMYIKGYCTDCNIFPHRFILMEVIYSLTLCALTCEQGVTQGDKIVTNRNL
jgi:hypothetical protein